MQLQTSEFGSNPLMPTFPLRLDDAIKDNLRVDELIQDDSPAEEEGIEEESTHHKAPGEE